MTQRQKAMAARGILGRALRLTVEATADYLRESMRDKMWTAWFLVGFSMGAQIVTAATVMAAVVH